MSQKRQNIPHFAKRISEYISKTRGIPLGEAMKIFRNKEYTPAEFTSFIAKATEVTKEEQLCAGIKLIEQKESEDKKAMAGETVSVPGKGMPKISAQLVSNIGKAALCRTETAVLIELSRCQDPGASVIITNRMLSRKTGYSRTMTMNALNNLCEYGLITMENIGGWRYRVHINGNDFEHKYRFIQGYIPANMQIFREDCFKKATSAEQFLLLRMMFILPLKTYREEMKKDPSRGDETVTCYFLFEDLKSGFCQTSYYSGYAFTKTIARLKKDFGARKLSFNQYMEVKTDQHPFCPAGGHMLEITFRKGLFAVTGGSDNFIWKKHMLELVAEKQGICLTEEELDSAAKAFPRSESSIRNILSKGTEYLGRIRSISHGKKTNDRRQSENTVSYDLALEESESFLVKIGDMVSRKTGAGFKSGKLRKRRLTDPILTTDSYLSSGDRIITATVVSELFIEKFYSLKNSVVRPLLKAADNAVQTVFRMYDPQGKFWKDRIHAECTA